MNETKLNSLKAVVVLHEGVPGHRNQSLGIAEELQKECGAEVKEFIVPNFRGIERLLKVKSKLKTLATLNLAEIEAWLEKAEGKLLMEEIQKWLEENQIKPEEVLLISAGSRAAPYTFGIAKVTGFASATLMTPKYLGTKPFDFAIIPLSSNSSCMLTPANINSTTIVTTSAISVIALFCFSFFI